MMRWSTRCRASLSSNITLLTNPFEKWPGKRALILWTMDAALGGNKEYFIDLVHYTPAGVQKLAKTYADFIIANSIVK